MTITKELCEQKIADLATAKDNLMAQANGCEGAIQTWRAVVELLDESDERPGQEQVVDVPAGRTDAPLGQ